MANTHTPTQTHAHTCTREVNTLDKITWKDKYNQPYYCDVSNITEIDPQGNYACLKDESMTSDSLNITIFLFSYFLIFLLLCLFER
jgi:hypothetical protein